MIKIIFSCFVTAITANILYNIPRNPKEKISDYGIKSYICPTCKKNCTYWYYNDKKDTSISIFELKCHKYCDNCGTKLNYKKINNLSEIIVNNEK